MSKTWSPLQTAIFNLIEDPNGGNAIIEAVAGSGKTTTIVEGVKRARGTTIFLAFNKSIAEELKSRGVNARTFHSLTYGAVTQHKGVRTVEADKLRRLCDAKLKGEEVQIYGAFITKLDAYRDREVEKALAKKDDAKVEAIEDRIGAITCLIDSMPETERTIPALLNTIDSLFADKKNAVVLATIHKSKGLEADRVFWLGRNECPAKWARQDWQKQQEINLCYVAATRAKRALYTIEARA